MKKQTLYLIFGLGIAPFSMTSVYATELIAARLKVFPTCTGCHTHQTGDENNLMPAAKAAYNKDKFKLSGLETFLNSTTTTLTCIPPEVLNSAKTACLAPSPLVNTKPVLNSVAPQWDVTVGELLTIPLTVNDAEQDEFSIIGSKLIGSSYSDVQTDATGLPSIDFEFTPTATQVNKIFTVTFQAKETQTAKHLMSNKVTVKIRVWAAGDKNAASITKLNVTKSKSVAGILNLAGSVTFSKLLTTAEQQDFTSQNLTLSISDKNGTLLDTAPLTWSTKGKWVATLPIAQTVCDIVLRFEGQNASRKVAGCTK